MLFFDANVASENRPVGTESEPTRKRDSKTDQAPGDATQTAASRVYHSSENGGGIAGVEVLIQIAKYAIIVCWLSWERSTPLHSGVSHTH